MFQVSVVEQGQLDLALTGAELDYTVVGRDTGYSQIVGMALVKTSVAGQTIEVRNPIANGSALTIEPYAGSYNTTTPVAAQLIITQLQ
jgi:hypothetical protein